MDREELRQWTVPLELAREPELVWGLRLSDLPWLFGGGMGEVWIWHQVQPVVGRVAAMAVVAAISAALGWGRWEGEGVVTWLWRWGRWRLGSRLFLP
ncbi:MAG: hypothetical protein K6U14_09740 [Firmicutes bacterium]|nr:hypothetical protein [Alicyclobacillaceae bacterium]MCL6497894.1 hypothetical protein [Bacillota bacterium]